MSNTLGEADLARLPIGALVKDYDQDYYEKIGTTSWRRVNRDSADGYQDVSDFRLAVWQPELVREDVGQPQGKPETWGYPDNLISEIPLTEETHMYGLAGESVSLREITHSVVLDARANFVRDMVDEGFDDEWASAFFTSLVREEHVTDKFLFDYANLED